MNIVELFLIAVGLSADAFAVAICIGLSLPKATIGNCLTAGIYFGVFQAGMPLAGYFLTATFLAEHIIAYGHWVAFGVLFFLGGRMVIGSFAKEKEVKTQNAESVRKLSPAKMLPLAVATSIDAMAVGVLFAVNKVNVFSAVALIGITTFLISILGVKIGNVFGSKFKAKAEIAGGIILILIGVKIILENLKII